MSSPTSTSSLQIKISQSILSADPKLERTEEKNIPSSISVLFSAAKMKESDICLGLVNSKPIGLCF